MPASVQPDDDAIVASIVMELIPELQYAAPTLLKRFDRGEPLLGTTSSSYLGFEGGVDWVVLELFRALVPCVKTALGCGLLTTIQLWRLHERSSRSQAVLAAQLSMLLVQNAELRKIIGSIAHLLARHDGAPVGASEVVVESIAAAVCWIDTTGEVRPPA